MNPDKFLTDLAALTECETVVVAYYAQDDLFEVRLRKQLGDGFEFFAVTTGPTVEAAMQEARARLAAHYEGEPA